MRNSQDKYWSISYKNWVSRLQEWTLLLQKNRTRSGLSFISSFLILLFLHISYPRFAMSPGRKHVCQELHSIREDTLHLFVCFQDLKYQGRNSDPSWIWCHPWSYSEDGGVGSRIMSDYGHFYWKSQGWNSGEKHSSQKKGRWGCCSLKKEREVRKARQ